MRKDTITVKELYKRFKDGRLKLYGDIKINVALYEVYSQVQKFESPKVLIKETSGGLDWYTKNTFLNFLLLYIDNQIEGVGIKFENLPEYKKFNILENKIDIVIYNAADVYYMFDELEEALEEIFGK